MNSIKVKVGCWMLTYWLARWPRGPSGSDKSSGTLESNTAH
jgi:hypothetical protein